jgi:hypothetical protein
MHQCICSEIFPHGLPILKDHITNPFLINNVLRIALSAFRIVTPMAREWATFEKDGGTDAGSVVYGKTLDIKNKALHGEMVDLEIVSRCYSG